MRTETRDKVRVGPPPIQTAEDARVAFLREEITKSELDEILALYGHTVEDSPLVPHPNSFDRFDDAFRRHLPDTPEPEKVTVEERLKMVENKQKQREAAEKATPKPEFKAAPVSVAGDPNVPAKKAADKVAAKMPVPKAASGGTTTDKSTTASKPRGTVTKKSASTSK